MSALTPFLDIVERGAALSEAQMVEAMTLIMEGKAADDSLRSFLINLSERGETVEEITGAAHVMRTKASAIQAPAGAVDCCGTGGDHSGSYNISTAVALVAAACGVPMAKHGNRSASSKSGAADALEALGVNLDMSVERLEEALLAFNFTFLMATNHHSAMKHVVPVRKALGRRTIFNLLGPLANPAGTKHQLIGVFDKQWLAPMAQTLKKLGTKRAWVVHGSDGLDEITVTGPSYIVKLDEQRQLETQEITPEEFGLNRYESSALIGGDAKENAQALRRILNAEKGDLAAYRDIVIANTAAVLIIHGSANDLKDGAHKAAQAIDSGAALDVLNRYAKFSNGEQPS